MQAYINIRIVAFNIYINTIILSDYDQVHDIKKIPTLNQCQPSAMKNDASEKNVCFKTLTSKETGIFG